jgi:hypothetical protein
MRDLLEITGVPRDLLLEPDYVRLGIGIVVTGDELVFSFDFLR